MYAGTAPARSSSMSFEDAAKLANLNASNLRGITSTLALITPEIAAAMLSNNAHNRSLSQSRVNAIAKDIETGSFHVNGESIIIGEDGRLLDGQTRLAAVVKAGKSIVTLLVTGVPSSTFASIDQGAARSAGDVMKIRGERYPLVLAGTLRMLYMYNTADWSVKATHASLEQMLEDYPEARESSERVGSTIRYMPLSLLAFLDVLGRRANPALTEQFIEDVRTGANLERSSAALHLRERIRNRFHGVTNQRVRAALGMKALNAHLENREMYVLKFSDGESTPVVSAAPPAWLVKMGGK